VTIPLQYIQSFNWHSSRYTLKIFHTDYKETCVTYDTKAYMELIKYKEIPKHVTYKHLQVQSSEILTTQL